MANQKKFKNPVVLNIRIEKEMKEYIIKHFGNITEFVNKAIKKEIKKDGKK